MAELEKALLVPCAAYCRGGGAVAYVYCWDMAYIGGEDIHSSTSVRMLGARYYYGGDIVN